jgi:replicative DNA helicase
VILPVGSGRGVGVARGGSTRSRGDGGAAPEIAGRVPPHDLDAERSVLSALLIDPRAFIDVADEVRADDFYHPAHQALYKSMVALHDEQSPVDLVTLSDYLSTRKLLDAIGGPVFLAEIADFEATAAHVVHHARIVRDKAVKRRLIEVATQVVESVYEDQGSSGELLDAAESRVFDIGRSQSRSSFRSLHDEMEPTFDYVEAIMSRAGSLTGIPTDFADLDEMTGGLQNGELVILAARPSMGKTALALNIARNAAMDHGKKVAVFSLEMTTRALVLRLLSSEARVDFSIFRSKYVPTRDFTRLSQAGTRLANAEIWIDDSGSLTILEIKAKCRRLKADKGLDLVILDYLQLAHADGRRERKDLEIAEISQGLKALAKELSIPVVALSQLNRGPEQRDPDKRRPNMGDLRESGAIEQDADLIAFIYRDHVYNREADPHDAELIIAKQRNGPTGTVHLHFEGRYARFESRTRPGFEGEAPAPSGGFVGPGEASGQEFGPLPPDDDSAF